VYGVKITDFGFSCFGIDDDLVQLPLSMPWQAPEYSDRPVLVRAAKQMDVYSFGLLLFWILFRDETFVCKNGSIVTIDEAFRGQDESVRESLQNHKQNGTILMLALNQLSRKAELDEHMRHRVQAVFQMALERDPGKRAPDMQPFVELLCKDESLEPADRATSHDIVRLPDWHGKIDVSKFFFEVDACDSRVQNCLAKSLMAMADSPGCTICSQNAALQVALCYYFGFGVEANDDQRQSWLLRSGRDTGYFEKLSQIIKEMDSPVAVMQQISDLGYQSDLGSEYYQDGILEQALRQHRDMAKARELAFGRSHFSAIRMYAMLADLLAYDRQLDEAAAIFEQELHVTGSLHSSQSDRSLVQSKLARIYIRQGKLKEAELILSDVLKFYGKGEEDGMAYRIHALSDMCDLVLRMGDQNRAMEMALAAVEESRQHLGPFHEITWRIEGIQVDAYIKAGELREALKIIDMVSSEKQQAFGREHQDTIAWMSRRGPIYVELNDWEKARDCFEEVEELHHRSDASTRLQELIARSNYMGALARTGQAERAAEALQDVISELCHILPPTSLHILGSKNNLAIAFQSQGLYEAAEPLQQDVVQGFQNQLPYGDDRVLRALGNLSDTLYNLKKWEDTAMFSVEELKARQSRQMEVSEELVHAVQKAGRSNAHLGRWNDAAAQLLQEQEWRKAVRTIDTIDGLDATALLAVAYMHLEQREPALQKVGELFERFLKVQMARISLLDTIYELAELCDARQMPAEAEELFKLAVLIRQALLPDSKGTLQESADEARILDLMRRQGKATDDIRFDPSDIIERTKQVQ